MIGNVLVFLKDQLNDYLNTRSGRDPAEPGEDRVAFVDGEKLDTMTFKLGAITPLLVNLEEETAVRTPTPYRRTLPDGTVLAVEREIHLHLYVLFIARFKQYEQGLEHLSRVIQFFQNHRLLDHQNAPALPPGVDKLVIELVTLPFAMQNEIWSALRSSYHPSALYKVSLVSFKDDMGIEPSTIRQVRLEHGTS